MRAKDGNSIEKKEAKEMLHQLNKAIASNSVCLVACHVQAIEILEALKAASLGFQAGC